MDGNNYLAIYKKWAADTKQDKRLLAFEKVITDKFFRQIPAQKEDEKPEEKAARNSATKQARTLAWSVTYFLAQAEDQTGKHVNLDNLLLYFQELAKLPRDLPFDEDVLLLTFARAFDLVDAKDPNKVNMSKLHALATKWDSYMSSTPLELDPVLKSIDEVKKEIKQLVLKPPQGQGRGGYPGGFGPPMGGGGASGGP